MKKMVVGIICLSLSIITCFAQQTVKVTTWNIEHLGSDGRGLGGIGAGSLGLRSPVQISLIANLIKDTLKTDLLAVQEVALSKIVNGHKRNFQLDTLMHYLGKDWKYIMGASGNEQKPGTQIHNLQNAFIWNSSKVKLLSNFDMDIPNIDIGGKAFDRQPLVGYFETLVDGDPDRTDFLLVNVHLKSGQDNDENHLAVMVIIEQNLKGYLKKNNISESDHIIMGDFNDNPYDKRYMDFLYTYMQYKKFTDLVTEQIGATRMDDGLTSIIDHILVNESMQKEMNEVKVVKYLPSHNRDSLAVWRKTYSDHFPISFEIVVRKDKDKD